MTTACMTLDDYLYAPTVAHAADDLFAAAVQIPQTLKQELKGAIVTDDDIPVSAWALVHDANNPQDTTFRGRHRTGILYCHGNNQNLGRFALRAQALWAMGYTVLAFDYRGYGKTPGLPSEEGTYRDGRAARAYLVDQALGLGIEPSRLALYGYSLGAAICSQLAVDEPTPALILEAPFASVAALVGDDTALGLPQRGFTHARYDTEGKLAAYPGGLLVLHGTDDLYLMARYGRQVAQAAVRAWPNIFTPVPGADHETVPCAVKDRRSPTPGACVGGIDPDYIDWVSSFIDGVIPPV
jgi:acetyl esterase/lipase